MNITTTKTSARNGAGNIVAKSRGKQKTTRYNHALSPDKNHAEAAANLILAQSWKVDLDAEVGMETNDHGGVYKWTFVER